MIGQTISHYKILEKLGEGGMGVVYKAHDTKLDRVVALKFLPHYLTSNDTERARFLQEARAASALNHPNVCVIHAIEDWEDPASGLKQPFIAMEYVDGETLRHKFSESPLKINDAVGYAVQIGEALQEAHSKGIVHRDVKSENIMINPKNQVKVMDFGLAKLRGSVKLTKSSSTTGTLAYMAPEQIQGQPVDARADIFSFGVVLYEMLTGHTPFRGEHEAAMMYSIVNEEPQPIQKYREDVSSELLHILNRALEKDPEERYQTVKDMTIDLRRLKKESTRVVRTSVERDLSSSEISTDRTKVRYTVSKKTFWFGVGSVTIVVAIIIAFSIFPMKKTELNPRMTFRTLKIPFTQIQYPGLSSDGNWAAFPAADERGNWDAYYMNTSTGEPRRITFDSSFVWTTDLSPDGSQIAYSRFDTRIRKTEILVVSSLGGPKKKIAEGFWPRWRPDGQRVGYIVQSPASTSGYKEFHSVKTDGNDHRIELVDSLGTNGHLSFSWSRDGRSIAWLRSFESLYEEVILHDLETGVETQLTFDKTTIDEVCWTPNGNIIFSSNRGGNSNLWMIPSSGGEAVQITKGSGPDIGMKISSDGTKLLYLQQQFVGHLWAGSLDAGTARQITFGDGNADAPCFSPDRKYILFRLGNSDPLRNSSVIYLMEGKGNDRREITSENEISDRAIWSPDGKWILYRVRTETFDSSRFYIVNTANYESPKFVGVGRFAFWNGPLELIIGTGRGVKRTSLDGRVVQTLSDDSTWVIPFQNGQYALSIDFRAPWRGCWLIQPSRPQLKPRLVTLFNVLDDLGSVVLSLVAEQHFLYYVKSRGELWRVAIPECREERVPGYFHGLSGDFNVSSDGKYIVYTDQQIIAKLVMIENLFK